MLVARGGSVGRFRDLNDQGQFYADRSGEYTNIMVFPAWVLDGAAWRQLSRCWS